MLLHRKRAVINNPKWDFIHQLVQKIADLPEPVEGEVPKRSRKKKESTDEDGEEVKIKKSGAKRASATPKKPRKKKGQEEDVEGEASMAESVEMQATTMEIVEVMSSGAPVFVDVSLAATSTVSAPQIPAVVDEDDFDA
jgi:hypothetical protein